jgi:hypothetical protein
MKTITGYVVGIVVLVLVGAGLLKTAAYERDLADAQQQLSTMRFAQASASLDKASDDAKYADWVPSLGAATQTDIRARRASLDYWQQRYDAVIPRQSDPVGAVEGDNVDLQLVVADAAYRAGQATVTDKASTLQALDEAISNYLSVLKNDTWDEDAAYNYEYLVRLRDDIAKGRKKAVEQRASSELGQVGAPAKSGAADARKFQIYVPLQGNERSEAAQAGKGTPIKRKG